MIISHTQDAPQPLPCGPLIDWDMEQALYASSTLQQTQLQRGTAGGGGASSSGSGSLGERGSGQQEKMQGGEGSVGGLSSSASTGMDNTVLCYVYYVYYVCNTVLLYVYGKGFWLFETQPLLGSKGNTPYIITTSYKQVSRATSYKQVDDTGVIQASFPP